MKTWFTEFLFLPTLDGNLERERKARLLNLFLVATALGSVLYLLVIAFTQSDFMDHLKHLLPFVILLPLIRIMITTGRLALASYLFTAGVYLLLFYNTISGNGLYSISFLAMILVVLIAWLLQGLRAGVAYSVLVILTGVFLAIAEKYHALPSPSTVSSAESFLFTYGIVLVSVSVVLYLSIKSLKDEITERRSSEEALRASEDRFRRMAESMQDGLSIIEQGKVIYANRRLCEITGLSPEEILKKTGLDIIAPEEQERIRQIIDQGRKEGIFPEQLDYWIVRTDGVRRYIQNRYTANRWSGRFMDRYVVTTDLTEQKLAQEVQQKLEQALVESEGRYRSLFESNQSIMLLIDPATSQIDDCNPAACAFYGYSKAELTSRMFSDITQQTSAKVQELRASLEQLDQQQTFRLKHCLASGETRDVEAYLGPITVRGRNLIYALIHDITERVQAEEKLNQQLRNLAALHAIDKAITTFADLDTVLETVLFYVISQLNVNAADILLYDEFSKTLTYGTELGFRSSTLKNTTLSLSECYCERVVREGTLLSVPNLALLREQGEQQPKSWEKEGFVTYLAIPLKARGSLKGVLELYHRTTLEPDESWMNLLDMLSRQTAVAMDNASLLADLQRSNLELTEAYDTTLEGWAQALEMRDKETEGHSRRVTSKTALLARALKIDDDLLVHVRRGALLHDIGKMGVPDSILLKPDKLSEEEWEIMRQHPVYAYELLRRISFLQPALGIPYCHHERWDGNGYPRRLKERQIPLEARIFALVDVWDALSSDRPYRRAWPKEKIVAYFHEQSGTQFDPQLVPIFLSLVEKEGSEDVLVDVD